MLSPTVIILWVIDIAIPGSLQKFLSKSEIWLTNKSIIIMTTNLKRAFEKAKKQSKLTLGEWIQELLLTIDRP